MQLQAELRDALGKSEDRYRRMVETSPDGIWIHRHGRTLYANPALVQILGANAVRVFSL